MAACFTVLASGSGGNASLIEADGFGLLLDLGLGPRQLARRLEPVPACWRRIHAVLLTHAHSDHWNERSFVQLLKRHIHLYCHGEHEKRLERESEAFVELQKCGLVCRYEIAEAFSLGPGMCLVPLSLSHDGAATCGFRIGGPEDLFGETWSLGYAADLGTWCPKLVTAFRDVDVLAVEFNHDVELEMHSGRSADLIARVLGDRGHLSNEQAACFVKEIVGQSEPGRPRHLVQLHLSRDCNRPELARDAVRQAIGLDHPLRVHTARQDRPGPRLALGPKMKTAGTRRHQERVFKVLRELCGKGPEIAN